MLELSGKVVAKSHPETGAIFTVGTKNPEWSGVRVESSQLSNKNGMITLQKRVAFVRLQTSLAEELVNAGLLKDGKELPIKGKIIITESFEPQFEGQEPKINPTTMEVVEFAGQPVFRQAIFSTSETAKDVFIEDVAAGLTTEPIMIEEVVGAEQTI